LSALYLKSQVDIASSFTDTAAFAVMMHPTPLGNSAGLAGQIKRAQSIRRFSHSTDPVTGLIGRLSDAGGGERLRHNNRHDSTAGATAIYTTTGDSSNVDIWENGTLKTSVAVTRTEERCRLFDIGTRGAGGYTNASDAYEFSSTTGAERCGLALVHAISGRSGLRHHGPVRILNLTCDRRTRCIHSFCKTGRRFAAARAQ